MSLDVLKKFADSVGEDKESFLSAISSIEESNSANLGRIATLEKDVKKAAER